LAHHLHLPLSISGFGRSLEEIAMDTTPNTRPGRISYALIAGLLGAPTIIVIIALLVGGVFRW
jgi:hypothetical protein